MTALSSFIDHTLLKPEATLQQIELLCKEAKEYEFASVCVNPVWVEHCASMLKESPVKVATVIGFPLGATTPEVKAFEAKQAVSHGAQEVDMVMNIGALKSNQLELVKQDIHAVVKATEGKAIVKVILETGLLSNEEIMESSKLAVEAGAHYVKTSTGFGPGGATVEHVKLMRETVGANIGVKASGGVRDAETAQAMVNAGASRIGTSSGVAIVSGKTGQGQY